MSQIDDRIRAAVHEAAEEIPPTSPDALLGTIQAGPAPRAAGGGRGRVVLAAAAVVAALAGAAMVLADRGPQANDPTTSLETEEPDPATAGFSALGSGWHLLDTGPVEAASSYATALAWTGTELVVIARAEAHAYDPTTGTWTDLELPAAFGEDFVDAPFEAVWADGHLVVTSERTDPDVRAAAVLDAELGEWTMLDAPPLSPKLAAVLPPGASGIGFFGATSNLVWTGERVLDLRHGAVLDLDAGTWSELALPDDLMRFAGVTGTTPVWTGSEVVALPWSPTPGLAWSADGASFRELDPPPAALLGSFNVARTAHAALVGPEIHLVVRPMEGTDDLTTGPRLVWDLASETWSAADPVPSMTSSADCPQAMASVGDRLVVETCDPERPPVVEGTGGWTELDAIPIPTQCCLTRWIAAGDALVVWETDIDAINNLDAPYVRAAVWVP